MTASPAEPDTGNRLAALVLEILDLPLVFFGGFSGVERAEISSFSGFSIYLSRIEAIFSTF